MGADDHVQFPRLQLADDLLLLLRGLEARERVHLDGEAVEAVHHRGVVLLHKDGGRGQERRLLAAHHALEDGAQGHFGLAVAHVAAEQAVHDARLFHVALDVLDGGELVGGLLVGEAVLELALPGGVRVEGVAGRGLAVGVEFQKFAGNLLDGGLDARLLPLPFAAGEAVEFGRLALGADVFLHAVELVGGHVEFVRALIADVQKVAVGALRGEAHRAHVLADAVVFVHHVVADGEVGKRGQLFAALGAGARLLAAHAEDVRFADHGKFCRGIEEAARERGGQDDRLALRQRLGRLVRQLRLYLLRRQRRLQALCARHAAGQQRHAPALVEPLVQIARQFRDVAHVPGGVAALELQDGLEFEVRLRAQKGIEGQHAAAVRAGEGLVPGQKQFGLFGQGFVVFEGGGEVFLKFQRPVLGALAQARGLVEDEDGVVQIVDGGGGKAGQYGHKAVRAVKVVSGFQRGQRGMEIAGEGAGFGGVGALPFLTGEFQKILVGDEVELALEALLPALAAQRPGAMGEHRLERVRRAQVFLAGEQRFRGGVNADALEMGGGALGHDVKGAQRVHLVVEELQTHGLGHAHGVDVEYAAAQGALAARLHQRRALVTGRHEAGDELGRLHAHVGRDLKDVLQKALAGHLAAQKRFSAHHHRLCFARSRRAQRLEAAHGQFAAGRRRAHKGYVPRRQKRRAAAQQGVEVFAHALGGDLVGGHEQKRPAQFARRGHGQMQFLCVVQPAGQRGPRAGEGVREGAKFACCLQRGKETAQVFVHSSVSSARSARGNWWANSSAVAVTARKSATGSARYTAMVLSMGSMAGRR